MFSPADQAKVAGFCDVDEKKIAQGYKTPSGKVLPVVHFEQAAPPLLVCPSPATAPF